MMPNANPDASEAAQAAQAAARAAQEAAAGVAESVEQIETNKNDITQLKDALTDMDGKIAASLVTNTASGAIASFPDGANNVPVKDLVVDIEPVQSGSGEPSPTNVRPISGWTGANVVRTGKNLYCGTKATSPSIIYGGENQGANVIDEDYTFKPGTYRLSFELEGEGTSNPSMFFSTKVGGVWTVPMNRGQVTSFTFTVPEHCEHLEIWAYGGTFTELKNIQIELSSTATAYEPSNGNTYNIDWTTEAGTVYGGTLDVTTGVLTVDRAYLTNEQLIASGWESAGRGIFVAPSTYVLPNVADTSYVNPKLIASALPTKSQNALYTETSAQMGIAQWWGNRFAIALADSSISSTSAFREKLAENGTDVVYPIATPQTYQLTPTEVSTLLGQNNIWCDCGDTTVDYRADTKLYIEQLTAPTEDDMTANTNIPSGTYFMVGNTLYLSTTTIPAGDTINPGTNCTLMNLASALNALNA